MGALLLLVVLLLTVTALQRPPLDEAGPPFDLRSARPTGLLGLVRWLEAMGYRVESGDARQAVQPGDTALLFVYPNQRLYTVDDAQKLRAWVNDGGTLVLVGPAPDDAALVDAFGVHMVAAAGVAGAVHQVQPLLPEGHASYWPSLQFDAATLDLAGAANAVTMLANEDGEAVLAVQQVGSGAVWHMVPGLALSNDGLRQNHQGELLPALLRTTPPGGTIVFDTAQPDPAGEQPIATLQDWLYRTPGGWATLLGLAACAVFLVLQGRRLGPALATSEDHPRREAAEHVRAMAAMARRARLSRDLAEFQRVRLKRGLARRYPVSADLPDAEFVDRLRRATPAVAPAVVAQVESVLSALQPASDEQKLVAAAAAIDGLLRDAGERPSG